MAATPNLTGRLNSTRAPPSLLSTIPVRIITSLFPMVATGAIDSSHRRQVSPRKSVAAGAVSTKGVGFGMEGSGPYQPMAEALMTTPTLFGIIFYELTTKGRPA